MDCITGLSRLCVNNALRFFRASICHSRRIGRNARASDQLFDIYACDGVLVIRMFCYTCYWVLVLAKSEKGGKHTYTHAHTYIQCGVQLLCAVMELQGVFFCGGLTQAGFCGIGWGSTQPIISIWSLHILLIF